MKFEEILVALTIITGLIWLGDIVVMKVRKVRQRLAGKEPVLVEYSKAFFPVLFIVLILRSFIAEPFRIPSASMKPGLIEGDFILVNKFNYGIRVPILGYKLINIGTPKRGDVIVFRHQDHKDLIKRVVGLPGDHINYKDKVLYINNVPVKLTLKGLVRVEPDALLLRQTEKLGTNKHDIYIKPTAETIVYPFGDFIVPAKSYFVMGDNRDNSNDSRFWGTVADSAIIGRAFRIWWSWSGGILEFWHIKIRWDRLGKAIK